MLPLGIPAAARVAPGLPGQIGLGLAAAALFSSTFVLNRAVSLAGGPWVWNAALRYLDLAVILVLWIWLRRGRGHLAAVLALFRRRLGFWLVAGGVGFGLFYLCICYAADHAPGWIVAATWQSTILATPLVLVCFGERVALRGVLFALVILAGIAVLNAGAIAAGLPARQVLAGCVPVGLAAIAYPVGNQLLSRARHAGPDSAVLADPAACVLLMTLGALPVLLLAVLVVAPAAPGAGQMVSAAAVALLAGFGATTLFLHARNRSADPYRIAAVDATQAAEVGFALLGETVLLGAAAPDLTGWIGLGAVTAGLLGFLLASRPA